MRDLLPTFHDANDSSLCLVIAIRSHTLVGLLVLGFGLFSLDLIYLNAIFRMRKVEIDSERVTGIDIFAFWSFAKNAVTSACEGLQGSLEFDVI